MLIDTYKSVKDLTGAGMPVQQAEALVNIISATNKQVATKDDLEFATNDLRSELKASENHLHHELELLRRDLTIKMYATGITIAALVIGFGVLG